LGRADQQQAEAASASAAGVQQIGILLKDVSN
jgi:hypothetical protein